MEKIFHKVKQKRGKPFYFGRDHQTLVFALPGNPGLYSLVFMNILRLPSAVLPDQESYLMNSFAISDCLIKLDEEREYYKKGEMVELIKIT